MPSTLQTAAMLEAYKSSPSIAGFIAKRQDQLRSCSNVDSFCQQISSQWAFSEQVPFIPQNQQFKICSVSTIQFEIPNICDTDYSHITTAICIKTTAHETANRMLTCFDVPSPYQELNQEELVHMEVYYPNIIGVGDKTSKRLRAERLQSIVLSKQFKQYLSDFEVDALLIDDEVTQKVISDLKLSCPVFLIAQAKDKAVYSFIDSLHPDRKLTIPSYSLMHKQMSSLSVFKTAKDVVFFNDKNLSLAYVSDKHQDSRLKPHFIELQGGRTDEQVYAEKGVQRFFQQHWLSRINSEMLDTIQLKNIADRQEVEKLLYKSMNEAQETYLGNLDFNVVNG